MTINREMPRYVCHKQVWALKIASLKEGVEDKNSVLMSFSDEGYAPIHVDFDWYYRHKPEAGGYYVVYRDGYKSYSPAKAFEDGYTLQSGAPAAQAEHQDPTDYKAMFQQAVSSLAAISEAIGIPDDEAATGEPEIIIDFIRELRRERDEAVDAGYATPQPAAQADIIKQIARQWDGCMYDDAPGGEIDIGEAIRSAAARLGVAAQAAPAVPLLARALAEWHEDDGPVMWWAWNGHEWAGEPAWCGQPDDSDWPGYHTHWTPHPAMPAALTTQGASDGD